MVVRDAVADGLCAGDGGVRQRAPLGTAGDADGPQGSPAKQLMTDKMLDVLLALGALLVVVSGFVVVCSCWTGTAEKFVNLLFTKPPR